MIVASVGEARRLGVPEAKWVYIHGTADAYEWPVQTFHRKDHITDFLVIPSLESTNQLGINVHTVHDGFHIDVVVCGPSFFDAMFLRATDSCES